MTNLDVQYKIYKCKQCLIAVIKQKLYAFLSV